MTWFTRTLVLGVVLAVVVGVVPALALAHDGEDGDRNAATLEERKETREENRREAANKRLTGAKLRSCEQRAQNIQAIMDRSVARSEKQLELFGTIADRVKVFYLEQDNVLENYDNLVAAVASAESRAEAALTELKAHHFSCDSEDPKGDVAAFKVDLDGMRHALKNYRTAVKDLIKGVRSVQGEAS